MFSGLLTQSSLISDNFLLTDSNSDNVSQPSLINVRQIRICLEIMNEPVYDISNQLWLGRNFDLGFELSLSGTNSINSMIKTPKIDKNFAKFLNEEWMNQLKTKGRLWKNVIGLIPYRLIKKFNGEYKIDICMIGTGNIFIQYN